MNKTQKSVLKTTWAVLNISWNNFWTEVTWWKKKLFKLVGVPSISSVWELLIVSHQPTKFGGHRHCASGDINIPANTVILLQMQDIRYCVCPHTSAIFIFCKVHRMSCATHVSNNKLKNIFIFYGNIF